MIRLPLAAGTIVVAAVCALASPPQGRAATFALCGQITNGPHLAWTLRLPGRAPVALSGRTWTVVSTNGVPCAKARAITRMLLKKFPAKRITPPAGFDLCGTEAQNGQVNCYDLKHDRVVTAWETDPLTYAQVKQIAASGALPRK